MNSKMPPVKTAAETGAFDAVIFEVLGHPYAIRIFELDQILPMMEIRPLAENAEHHESMIVLRGEPVPVVDLRKHFGRARTEWPWDSRILILSTLKKKLGWIVDRVREIQPVISCSAAENSRTRELSGKLVRLPNGEILEMLDPDLNLRPEKK